MRQTIPLVWDESTPNELRPSLPEIPEGQYLAWSCINEEDGTVSFELKPIPEPPPDDDSPTE